MLHAPSLVAAHRAYNRALRTVPGLEPALTELAILLAARAMNQAFEWTVHEREARKAGLDPRAIEVVRQGLDVEGLDVQGLGAREAALIRLGREVFEARRVSPDTYAEAERLLGRGPLVSLTAIMAAVLLTVFDQQLPAGVASTLPVP
jgi:4-carboxymuconolactone decarboxylase